MSVPAPTTDPLAACTRRDGASTLARLVVRCLPDLRRWARGRLPRWVRTAADTSDLVHDAVVGTLPRLDTFEERGRRALAAYLRTAVRNRIRDEHRRAGRRGVPIALSDALADDARSPLEATIAAETDARYRAALSRLRPRDRELVVAHVELDYSHAQLGCLIGRSPHAARMALQRAVRRLASRMHDG